MKFKKGSKAFSPFGLKPEMVMIMPLVDQAYQEEAGQGVTFTSGTDSEHDTLIHGWGYGLDGRTRDDAGHNTTQWRPSTKDRIAKRIRDLLPDGYTVVVEVDHIHIQFDFMKVETR